MKNLTCDDGNTHYTTHIHVLQMENMRERTNSSREDKVWSGESGYSDCVLLVDPVRDVRPGFQRLIREFKVELPPPGRPAGLSDQGRVMFADVSGT